MPVNNGLSNSLRLTQSSLRAAGAETISDLREGDSDQDFADRWGASAGTVNNVQNSKHDLSLMLFLKLGERFGPRGINKALGLIGLVAAPREAVILDYSKVPHAVASALPLLIELLSDGECCEEDLRKLEDARVVQSLIDLGDDLRRRRSTLRAVPAA